MAIGHYTAAIIADRTDATFPLNRAAAYLRLGKYVGIARTEGFVLFSQRLSRRQDAARDCSSALVLDALNIKALFRLVQAIVG